jgi:hypothetical protein
LPTDRATAITSERPRHPPNRAAIAEKRLMPPIEHTTNLVALMLLLARIGDVGSTYLATPRLKLEANPIARRFRWPFAALTLFAAAIPYYSVPMGIAVLVASLLVSASNFSKLWLVRAMGEHEYHRLVVRMAGQSKVPASMLFILAPAVCMAAIGWLLLYFYPNPETDWAYGFAFGFFGYALAIAIWGTRAFFQFRREGIEGSSAQSAPAGLGGPS